MDGSQNPILIKIPQRHEVPIYWPIIEEWVRESVAYTAGCYEPIDIYRQILLGELGLWLMMDGDRPIAFATTRTDKSPRRWLLGVPFIGGTRLEEWWRPLLKHLEQFAKTCGCDGISGGGRQGWARLAGFEKRGLWLVKDI